MTPTHIKYRGRRYHYYVWRRLIEDPKANNGWRVPAEALEKVVLNGLNDVLETIAPDVAGISDLGTQVARTLLEKVTIDRGQMTIVLSEKGSEGLPADLAPSMVRT